jgi:hypothetical protein
MTGEVFKLKLERKRREKRDNYKQLPCSTANLWKPNFSKRYAGKRTNLFPGYLG